MRTTPRLALFTSITWFVVQTMLIAAAVLDPDQQAKVDAQAKEIAALAADPVVVNAVKTLNATPDPKYASITQDQWKELSVLDPLVRNLTKVPAAELLKSKRGPAVSEAFLSGANGTKAAFLSKPSNWSHKGKPKHDVPMSGKTWQGPIEVDESTGLQQIQIAVPVLEGGSPIGSLVVGLSLSKLNAP